MRILVDHSGYGLLNVGDIAMLQACVRRLLTLWPQAHIQVFTESAQRLQRYCPGVIPVAPTFAGRGGASALPKSGQLAAEQIWKTTAPLLAGRGRRDGSRRPTLLEAVRQADIVVASGGGFVNDVFWWHGAGVLSVLRMAQRLDKPTAMFGQGVGPLRHPLLRRLVALTMPRVEVIGLREGVQSVPILLAHGVDPERISVTGDDALLMATTATRPPTGDMIGINVRVASYSAVDQTVGGRVVSATRQEAACRGTSTVAIPVEHNKAASDVHAIADHAAADIRTPDELAEQVARCRVVVTGSYHAAVFGLAAGVPAVCISNSRYYDAKFAGLAALFPSGCRLLRPGPKLEGQLAEAIERAWETGEDTRRDIHSAALSQVERAGRLYGRFKAVVGAAPEHEPTLQDHQ